MGIRVAGEVKWMAFSSNGSRLAIHDKMGVTVYDYSNGSIVFRLTGLRVLEGAYSPDGQFLACQGYKDMEGVPDKIEPLVQIWDITRNKQLCCIEYPRNNEFGAISCLKFSPNSTQLALVRDDGLVAVIRVETGQAFHLENPSKRFYSSSPSCVFFPGSEALVYIHLDEAIKIADLDAGHSRKLDRQLGAVEWNELIGFRPSDQKLLVVFRGKDDYHNRIDALDVRNGARAPFISGKRGYMWCPRNVTLSPSGDYLAASVLKEARSFLLTQPSYAVTVWDVRTGNVISEITTDKPTSQGLVSSVFSLAFCPAGNLLVGRRDSIEQVPVSSTAP